MQYTPYTLPTFASGLVALGAALYVWRMRPRPQGAVEFFWVALSVAWISFAYAAELTASSLQAKLGWLDVRWVGICTLPPTALALALRWGGYARWMTSGRWAALAVVPVVTLLLAWTNPWHELTGGPSALYARDGYTLRGASAGPMFWVFVAYAYACTLLVIGVYARALFWSPLHRRQAATLLIASIVPLAANAVYVFGIDVLFDVSQIGYGAACLLWAWGLRKQNLFDLLPVARAQVFDSFTDAVLVLGADRRILDANPAAAQLFGADTRLVGTALAEVVGGDLDAELKSGATLSLLGRAFEVDAATVQTKQQAATVLTLRDVTARRQLEAAREEALRLAEEAGEARARFLARMSHEVRGPLHGIAGSADLLLGSRLDESQKRYVNAVATSAGTLLALVNELLDFSKLDARRMAVTMGDVDARAAAEEVLRMFAGAADRKGVALSLEAPERIAVRADATRLKQVLINLVGNAVKFTDRGRITMRLRNEADRVRFEVEDTGIGINAAAHERIFEPFVQVDAAPGAQGTGLGLAIARQLVELMGGTMDLSSTPGAGSRFHFDLRASAGAMPVREAQDAPRAARRNGRVLLVDDNEVHRLVTAGLLEREGCEVEAVGSGAAALQAHAGRAFALIVTDVRMPEMDGHALAAALRQAGSRVPIVALSGDVYDGASAAARRAGLDDWLSKPIEPAALRAVLERWLPGEAEAPGRAPAETDLGGYLRANPALFAGVREAFLRCVPGEVQALIAASRAGQWQNVRNLAHGLKSAAGIAGASELEALCRRLEQARGADSLAEADLLPQALQRALAGLQPEPA